MSKLILGTAEFGPVAYGEGVKEPPKASEIVRILNLAWQNNVKTLDCSPAYGCDDIINAYAARFHRINKTRELPHKEAFYHYKEDEKPIDGVTKASVYTLEQLEGLNEAIIPFSIANTLFLKAPKWPKTVYFRSVFDRGRLLNNNFSIFDCLGFVARHPNDGIIVGVNSVPELYDILVALETLQ